MRRSTSTPGGAEARRSSVGWASWRQVWPTAETKFAHESASSTTFDVSDVDLTNIPEPDCEVEFQHRSTLSSCLLWSRAPEAGAAGKFRHPSDDTIYVHVTSPIPDDEAELEAFKQLLAPGYETESPQPHIGSRYKVEIVPVKYDFGQLWRWNVILDRFALSAGNTVGINGAHIGENIGAHGDDGHLVWMNGVEPAEAAEGDDWLSERRQILIVGAWDPHLAAQALPKLLPLLGIPFDAVGLVEHDYRKPLISIPLAGQVFTDSGAPSETDSAGTKTGAGAGSETAGKSNISGIGNDSESTDAPLPGINSGGNADPQDSNTASNLVSETDYAASDETESAGKTSSAVNNSVSGDALDHGATPGGGVDSEADSKTEGVEAVAEGVSGADRSGEVAASGPVAERSASTSGVQTWFVAVSAAVIALVILGTAAFTVRSRRRSAT